MPLSMHRILRTWWPLAASWLFMATEGPMMSTVVARMIEPEINLAAWGGIVFPLALIIESPIIMLLSTSTALSKDWDSYIKLRRFMMRASAVLTALHALVAFTPLYYLVVVKLIGAPAEIVEPARLGLMIMLPWTWSIAYRRFNQGVLIRFGHSRTVGLGTLIRLSTDALVLAIGYLIGTIPGIVVAASAIACGVVCEAIYAGLSVRPVLRDQLRTAPPAKPPLTLRAFLDFYTPLAMMAFLNMLVQPVGSAALSRMPAAIESLAVWSVVSGFIFLFRSLGYAYNEVVIALMDEPRAEHALRRFAVWLTVLTSVALLTITATPLATIWFGHVSGLRSELVTLAQLGLWIALPVPGLTVLQKRYEGTIVHSRHTRGITEAMAVFLLTDSALLWAGVAWGQMTGLYVGLTALVIGVLMQTVWLWERSRPLLSALQSRDGTS